MVTCRGTAGGPHLTVPLQRVPHLRDGLIVAKVGNFHGSENPDTLTSPMPPGSNDTKRTDRWPDNRSRMPISTGQMRRSYAGAALVLQSEWRFSLESEARR